jgi:hypothetical protein
MALRAASRRLSRLPGGFLAVQHNGGAAQPRGAAVANAVELVCDARHCTVRAVMII